MFRNVVLRFYGLEFRPQPWPVPRTCPAISAKKSVLGTYACPARISSSIDIAGHDTVQQIAVYHVLTSRTSHSSATSFSPHIQRLYVTNTHGLQNATSRSGPFPHPRMCAPTLHCCCVLACVSKTCTLVCVQTSSVQEAMHVWQVHAWTDALCMLLCAQPLRCPLLCMCHVSVCLNSLWLCPHCPDLPQCWCFGVLTSQCSIQ